MCMYIYIYMYLFTYILMYLFIYVYICIYELACSFIYIYICMSNLLSHEHTAALSTSLSPSICVVLASLPFLGADMFFVWIAPSPPYVDL